MTPRARLQALRTAALALLLCCAQPVLAGQAVHIGILAEKDLADQREHWRALTDHLAAAHPEWDVTLQVLPLEELDHAIAQHRLEFVLTEPSHYARLQRRNSNARALATVVRRVADRPVSALAGTIIARADNPRVHDLASLQDQRIAVMGRDYLAAYQAQMEILLEAGIPPSRLSTLVKVEPQAEAVVRAVLARQADAGFVPAGLLEAMLADGKLRPGELRVIHAQALHGYPYAVSTRLYPEWPFVALPAASPDVARQITALLMNIERDSVLARQLQLHGFVPPDGYVAVADLARELRLPPFDQAAHFTFADIWERYRPWAASLLFAGALILLLLAGLVVYSRGLGRAKQKAEDSAAALAQSRERFDLAIKAFNGGLWDWDLITNEVYYSPRWKTMLGYADNELPNVFSTWEELVDPVGRASTLALIQDCLAGRRADFVAEFRMRHKTDGWRVILSRAIVVRDAAGKPVRIVGTHADITERVMSEQELAEAQRIAHVGHWRLEHNTQTFTGSDELCRIFELDPQARAVTQQDLWVRVHPRDQEMVKRALVAHYKEGAVLSLEHRLLLPDGRVKHLALRCETECDPDGNTVSTLGVVLDITRQKTLEEKLLEGETILRAERDFTNAVLDAAGSIIVVMDRSGQPVRFNRAAEEITGYRFEELRHQPIWSRLIPPEESVEYRRRFVAMEKQDIVGSYEAEWLMKDGSRRLFDWRYTALTDMTGEITYVIAQGYDITDKKATEEALFLYQHHLEDLVSKRTAELESARHEAERLLRVKSEFLANMSHEIRTPLNAVLGLAQIGVNDTVEDDDKNRINYRRILDSGQHLLGLINDILDFSKAEAGKLLLEKVPFRLGECIDRAVSYTAARAASQGLEFLVVEDGALPQEINGDLIRLTQVLVNLLGNAVKFTEHGRVSLSVSIEDGDLLFNISDTGIGMNEEQRARLFKPFEQANTSTTRRFGGTGLGMAISKRLVDAMGGRITVYSWEGVGTSITVHLPLAAIAAGPERTPHSCKTIRLAGFSANETENMTITLERAGIGVSPAELSAVYHGLRPEEAVLVAEAAFQSDAFKQQTRDALARGARVHLLCLPGGRSCAQGELYQQVKLLDWPLRARLLECGRRPDGMAAARGLSAGGRLAGISILAAEDNEVNRMVLQQLLRQEQARVRFAENGKVLLDIVDQEGADRFDLVLMDIQMPVMDGHEATRRLLARLPTMPVIGLTAHALAEERARCLASGMVEHVTKPIDLDVLVGAILKHVKRRQGGRLDVAPEATNTVMSKRDNQTPRPAAASADAATLIDWAELARRFGDRQAFIEKLVKVGTESLSAHQAQLTQAIAARDYAALAFQAHSLKGASGNLQANAVFGLAKETETLARATQADAWPAAARLSRLLEQLLGELASKAAPSSEHALS